MSEEVRKNEAPAAEKGKTEEEILSRKRKVALVSYLAVLFAVAFLLVALSMVIENRQLQTSSAEMRGTLNNRISALQEENITLKEENGQLTESNAQLIAERDDALKKQQDAERREKSLEDQKTDLINEKVALFSEITAAEKKLDDAKRVQELLYQAAEAEEAGDYETLETLLAQIEPNKDLLSPTALEIYESLIID